MDLHKQAHSCHTYKHFDGQKNALAMFYGETYIYILYIYIYIYTCMYVYNKYFI